MIHSVAMCTCFYVAAQMMHRVNGFVVRSQAPPGVHLELRPARILQHLGDQVTQRATFAL